MTDKLSVNAQKSRLLAMLEELAIDSNAAEDAREPVELDQQAIGRLSRMDAMQNQAMAQAAQRRRDTQSRRIRATLARIEAGEFGFCTDCGDEIEAKRLSFDPTIPKCQDCATG